MFKALRADNSPFTGKQIEQLQASLNELQPAQSAWLSGYIAGCLASNVVENVDTQSVLGEPVAQEKFHVFYAS